MLFRTSLIIGFLLLSRTPAFAQETTGSGTVMVDTGALIQTKMDALQSTLGGTLAQTSTDVFLSDAKEKSWQEEVGRYKQKSASFRATCRITIRKANRDSLMIQSSACLRGDLLLQAAFLRKQKIYIGTLPGIKPITLSGADVAIDNLIDAQMTIVDALDAKLFQTVNDLMNTKAKLMTTYRYPYWLAVSRIRADRQLTILGLMLKRMNSIVTDGASTPLIENSTLEALSCMQNAAESFQAIQEIGDVANAEKTMSDADKALPACRDAVWYVARLKNRQLDASTENAVQQTDAKK